uniref:Xylanolytic transcriptional activator regulatory domain-containing protein n=1 Tax=Kwoniella dejecticola CBS 10117 TaxID=1296121 RepID=A0A1A5ZZY7_9TREE|nr:uncharacterized protein I303_06923 [Kwoniella dejecticola CBS 10117]OBR83358.1 hypothetical protein I303_06923 [Kwoniella dejecticola CBS 10117]
MDGSSTESQLRARAPTVMSTSNVERSSSSHVEEDSAANCQEGFKEQCVYEGNIRNQPSPHLVPLLVRTFDFLRSISSPDSTRSDSTLRPLIRQFLNDNKIPTFTVPGQIGEGQHGLRQEPSDLTKREHSVISETIDESFANGEEDTAEGNSEVDELLMHMSLAEDGQNGHFGVTSLFYQTPSESVVEKLQRRLSRSQSSNRSGLQRPLTYQQEGTRLAIDRGQRKNSDDEIWATDEQSISTGPEDEAGILKANASMLGGWESLAYSKLELESDAATAKMIIHLLKTYFCWQYGSHCVVYRPVFIRDMALGGPYFNHFLLNVICAHQASGYMSGTSNGFSTPALALGADFMNKAKLLLAAEMDKVSASNVPTIQGLLLLGQRECACGNLSQGWQYTGMAFRAMRDLGIHLDCNRLPIFGFGTMSAEDREIRRRLFWSAYTWDKIISLALGRTPTFNAWQNASPGPIVDDTEDDLEWRPYFWDDAMPLELANYPPQKSLMTSNFKHFIKLCEIIQKIIMRLYNGRLSRMRSQRFVEHMKSRLLEWMDQLPNGLKLEVHALPEHCPPPHIFSTNALYRAAWILLYRIYLPNAVPVRTAAPPSITASAAETCTRMAEELHQLFLLYSKTFKLRNMTYTLSWSMYSAATINAMDFQSPSPAVSAAASPRLSMSLHVLERGSLQTPGTQRSIEIIKQRLREPTIRVAKRRAESPYDPDRHKRVQSLIESAGDQLQRDQLAPQLPNEPYSAETHSSTEFDLASIIDASVTNSNPAQTDDEDNVLSMWTELMQSGTGGAGNMDLLQGMMAMPSVVTAPNQYPTYSDWSNDWWTQTDS